ncbi:hypothetical protein WP39_29560 [Streptomyces sp. 604F]|nr:hypothetical protein [Streptomyces sp. 604F]
MGDRAARVAGDGQGQGADRGGLVDDHQEGAELGDQLVEDGPQFRLTAGQTPVEDLLPGRGVRPWPW